MHRSKRVARRLARWAVVCLGFATAACEPSSRVEPPPRYVDPPIVDKTLLIPETLAQLQARGDGTSTVTNGLRDPRFYLSRMLTASPRGAFTGVSRSSPLRVVRFEVTENLLLAREVPADWERTGGPAPIDEPSPQSHGDILAAYRIQSHFDIPAPPPVAEGAMPSADSRPWFARRYMRVDWSQNLVSSVDSRHHEMLDVPSEPLPIGFSGANPSGDAHFAADYSWFDLPERVLLHPERATVARGAPSDMNACELFDRDRRQACAPVEVSYRVSFRRRESELEMSPNASGVAPANSESLAVDDRFPVVTADRVDVRGSTVRIGARRDLFVRDHLVVTGPVSTRVCNRDRDCNVGEICSIGSAGGDVTHRGACAPIELDHVAASTTLPADPACSTDADCRIGGAHPMSSTARCDTDSHTCGEPFVRCSSDADCATRDPRSTCDLGIAIRRPDNRGLCTAPISSRVVQPVAIHLGAAIPADLEPAARRAVSDWNAVLRRIVVRARRRECQIEHNVDAADIASEVEPICNDPRLLGLAEGGDAERIVIGCHSPVWGTAAGAGMHGVDEVADARIHGWDLEACGPQGTIAREGDLRFDTLGTGSSLDGEVAWNSVFADPYDGRIVGAHAAIDLDRFESLAHDWVGAARAATGDLPLASTFGSRDATSGDVLADAILDAPFQRAGTIGRLRRAFAPLDGVSRDFGAMYDSAGLTVGAPRLESRFASLANGSLGQLARGGETPILADPGATVDEIDRVASPIGGERAEVRALRRRFENGVARDECALRYLRSDVARDAVIRRLVSGPIDCASEPSLCIDGPPPRLNGIVDPAALTHYARLHLAVGLFTHEIGHLLGLPHNLAASADALNYRDAYWQLRGVGHQALEPRHVSIGGARDGRYESVVESSVANENASSSVMDLLDPYTASLGTGRGDVAACGSLYTGTLEAFREVADRAHFDQFAFVSARRGITPLDLSDWQHGVVHALDYTQLPTWIGGSSTAIASLGDAQRFTVLVRESTRAPVMGWGDPSVSNADIAGHALVPYRAASEDDAITGWPAMAFDRGADVFESAYTLARDWIAGREFDASGATTGDLTAHGHLDTTRSRFVEPLRAIAASALPHEIIRRNVLPPAGIARTDVDDVPIAAAALAMNAMLGQMVVPRSSGYVPGFAPDGTDRLVADLVNGMHVGRTVESLFSPEGTWLAAGSWFDKLAAIDGAGDTTFTLTSANLALDIDLATLFPDAALRFAGGMLADDLADVGPRLYQHRLEFPDVMSLAFPPGTGVLENGRSSSDGRLALDPALDPSLAAVFDAHQLARWTLLGDRRYARFAAIWTDSERAVPDQPTVAYTDAASGRTYRAFHISAAIGAEGESVGASALVHAATMSRADEAGITARAILHLQDLAAVRDRAIADNDAPTRVIAERAIRDTLDRLDAIRAAQRFLESR